MADENENIQVVVRCRARNDKETKAKSPVVVHVNDEEGEEILLNPSNETGVSAKLNSKTYKFDKVFGAMSDQATIFKKVGEPLFDEFLKGYNCTLLVYGMTSTGKTYTMSGDVDNEGVTDHSGIIPRVLVKLFTVLEDLKTTSNEDYIVKCSFIEIYNEELKDLLSIDQNKKLRMFDQKDNKQSAIHIQNLHEEILINYKHGLKVLSKGLNFRQVASTKMNDVSSRSHAIFTINLFKQNKETGNLFRVSKMNLVDLAGSENISKSGALNQRAKEAGSINQSLLTLGRVISSLVEKQSQHIPYRESKLTRLLQDSLGGKTKTCMIATISPAKINYDETVSTLEYSNKAKSIKNKPQLGSSLTKDFLINELSIELSKLQKDFNSTKLKDGIFMDKDNYDNFMNDIQEYKTEISEMKRNYDSIKKQNEMLKKQLHDSEQTNIENLTMLNTLNSTVESLHNKIDKQKLNEENLLTTSTKFKEIISCVNSNLTTFQKFEVQIKEIINEIIRTSFKESYESISKTVNENLSQQSIIDNVSNIEKDVNSMILNLQRSTYDACKNVGESILEKFPSLFKDFDLNFKELSKLMIEFNDVINKNFEQLIKENQILRNDITLDNHQEFLNEEKVKIQEQIEINSNDLLNGIFALIKNHNENTKNSISSSISKTCNGVIDIEKQELTKLITPWETKTNQLIEKTQGESNKVIHTHNEKAALILKNLQETSKLTNISKTIIDKELNKIGQIAIDFKNNQQINKNLTEIEEKFKQNSVNNHELIKSLNDCKSSFEGIEEKLTTEIIKNETTSKIEVKDVDKLLVEFETEQSEIKKSLLPTGKTPIRQSQSVLRKSVRNNINTTTNKSPPKFSIGVATINSNNKRKSETISKLPTTISKRLKK